MNEMNMQDCEVIIYILARVGDDVYHAIKFFGNVTLGMSVEVHERLGSSRSLFRLGMVTECTRSDRLVAKSDTRKMGERR